MLLNTGLDRKASDSGAYSSTTVRPTRPRNGIIHMKTWVGRVILSLRAGNHPVRHSADREAIGPASAANPR